MTPAVRPCYISLMKMKFVVGFVIGLIILGSAQAAAAVSNKATFKSTGKQAAGLHSSLVPHASPAVRSRISDSAKAAKAYLAKCGRDCRLHSFLSSDLKSRFKKLNKQELDLLITLTYGEFAGMVTESELAALELQELEQEKELVITTVSRVMETQHDTLMSVINNIKP